jgi:hypothetical protein
MPDERPVAARFIRHLLKGFVSSICLHQRQGMPKMSKSNNNNQAIMPKRLSPELAEVLHMLKSLETQPAAKLVSVSAR